MSLKELIEIIEMWDSLGGSVQNQLKDVFIDGESIEDQNGNALQYMLHDFLEQLPDTISDKDHLIDKIRDYLNKD